MSDHITSLLSELQRLVQELNDQWKLTVDQQDNQKESKEIRLLEGQICAPGPDRILASKLKNSILMSPDEKVLGEINDLIIQADGTVAGLVIGVGDDKNIALKFERFQVTAEPDGCASIVLSATQEELQQAPDFNPALEQMPEEKLVQKANSSELASDGRDSSPTDGEI
jgi:hypothetical protein